MKQGNGKTNIECKGTEDANKQEGKKRIFHARALYLITPKKGGNLHNNNTYKHA